MPTKQKAHDPKIMGMDYICGIRRAPLLDIAGRARVMLVPRAEVNEINIFRQALPAGEGKPLARLNGFDDVDPFTVDDEAPLFAFLHRETRKLYRALKLNNRM